MSGGGDSTLRFWDVATGKQVRTLEVDGKQQVLSMRLSADGNHLLCTTTGFDDPRDSRRLTVWDVPSGKRLVSRSLGRGELTFSGFSPDGKLLAQSAQKEVVIVDAFSSKELARLRVDDQLEEPYVFSPDGRVLAARSSHLTPEGNRMRVDEYAIRLFDLSTGHEIQRLKTTGAGRPVAFAPDGKTLGSAGDDGVYLWDVASGREMLHRRGFDGSALSLAFSSDGRSLASGLSDSTILIWDVSRPAPRPDR